MPSIKYLKFRPRMVLVGAFAILIVTGSWFPRHSFAQTALACNTAVGALNGTEYAGKTLRWLFT